MRAAVALASLTLIAACGDGAVARADAAGTYSRTAPSPARLVIAPAGQNLWQVSLTASGRADGAATGADCQLEAEGQMRGDVLRARDVEITLIGDVARVSTTYQGCGVGVDLNGTYHRAGARELTAGDDVAQARARYPDTRLRIVEGYPWARFAVMREGRAIAVLTFDGENEDLTDGSNSFRRIGDTVDWAALKSSLKITRIEGPAS